MRVVRFLVVAFLFLPFGHFQAQGLSITSSTYLMDGQGVADQSNEEIEVTNDSDQSIAVVIGVEAICMADGDFSGISTCMGTACLPYVFLETFEYPVAENLGPGETMSGFLPVLSEELSEGCYAPDGDVYPYYP